MEKGTDPADPKVQAMARRWKDLVNAFTGGDPGIAQSLKRLWKEQGDNLVAQHGMQNDPRDVSEYIGRAMAAVKGSCLEGVHEERDGPQSASRKLPRRFMARGGLPATGRAGHDPS